MRTIFRRYVLLQSSGSSYVCGNGCFVTGFDSRLLCIEHRDHDVHTDATSLCETGGGAGLWPTASCVARAVREGTQRLMRSQTAPAVSTVIISASVTSSNGSNVFTA
jgi:hypothetical protein